MVELQQIQNFVKMHKYCIIYRSVLDFFFFGNMRRTSAPETPLQKSCGSITEPDSCTIINQTTEIIILSLVDTVITGADRGSKGKQRRALIVVERF